MKTIEKTKPSESYAQASDRQRKELNAFEGIFFAFSDSQFESGLLSVGLDIKDYSNKLASLQHGGFILRSRAKAFGDMFKRHDAERKEARKSEKFLLESLVYELRNHEYGYTYDTTDTLDDLGLDASELPAGMLQKACAKALEGFDA
jgi:hypothetical protein